MSRIFIAVNSRGPRWDPSRPLEGQAGWDAHAAFMDGLTAQGLVVLGGPLEGTPDALLVIRGESREQVAERLATDPWRGDGTLILRQLSPWQIRLGSLP